jgi:hypothetical protein
MSKIDKEFFASHDNWWSLAIVPLSYQNIVQAVAYGDAALKATTYTTDTIGVPDNFFRWVRKPKDRWCEYPVGDKNAKPTKNHPDYDIIKKMCRGAKRILKKATKI